MQGAVDAVGWIAAATVAADVVAVDTRPVGTVRAFAQLARMPLAALARCSAMLVRGVIAPRWQRMDESSPPQSSRCFYVRCQVAAVCDAPARSGGGELYEAPACHREIGSRERARSATLGQSEETNSGGAETAEQQNRKTLDAERKKGGSSSGTRGKQQGRRKAGSEKRNPATEHRTKRNASQNATRR